MAGVNIPSVGSVETIEDIKTYLYRVERSLKYLLGGNIGSQNIREVGGWDIGDSSITSVGGNVGLSNEDTASNDIRIWAGAGFVSRDSAPFRVYEDGRLVASNVTLTGGSITWAGTGGLNPPTAAQVGARADGWFPTPAQINALATDAPKLTYIDQFGVYTGTVMAQQVYAGTLTGLTIQTNVNGRRLMMTGPTIGSYSDFTKDGFELDGLSGDLLFWTNGVNTGGIRSDTSQGPEMLALSHNYRVDIYSAGTVSIGNTVKAQGYWDFATATTNGLKAPAIFG